MKLDAVLVLEQIGACSGWQNKASSRNAETLFDEAWDELNDPEKDGHGPALVWLANRLDPSTEPLFLCCNEGARICLLGFPFSAWVEAAQAYIRAHA